MIYVSPSRFRQMRHELGYTQGKVARLFGVTDQSVARWEKGQTAIPGAAKILIWMLFEQEVLGNRAVVRTYLAAHTSTRSG